MSADPVPADSEVLQDRADRPVLRIGDVVRHPRQPWSVSVHALLGYLAEAGFPESPVPVALEEDGTDREWDDVGYIEGVGGDAACQLVASDEAVAAVAQLLRRYHDVVAAWRPEVEPVWFDGQRGTGDGADHLVCHGDVGPWNLVWRDGSLVGLIDWEYATIGTRRTDIAYALHYLVPFRDRSYWQWVLGMPVKPRRRHRMAVFAEAYGIDVDEQLVDEVLASQQAGVDLMRTLAEQGRPRQQQLIANGELDREHRAVLWGQGHRHKFYAKRPRSRRMADRDDERPGGLR
ncbi:aminoglycoside phosphotransferase family protein [uncultured Friedmanniella sp.]|uniref:aminoglycoside phosphotransferase family protein n=1 Tax=uncultured Friedmanniella sp. TaxID=335381 RepID=UPI0035CC969F